MKSLVLSNTSFRYLEEGFKEWLDILGYSQAMVYYAPVHVRELLYSLEQQGIKNIKELDNKHIKAHYAKLKERANKKRGGSISNNYLNKHIHAIKKFTDYLRQMGRMEVAEVGLRNEEAETETITVLSEEEIQLLLKVTQKIYETDLRAPQQKIEAMQARDRAMLAIFYGCGLRRNEGVNLNVSDIDFDKALLHVRKGKNYKERFVPISKRCLKDLQVYVYDHRPELLISSKLEALFISQQGTRMQGQSLLKRLHYLQHQTNDAALMEKEIGLHTLRHSIATHLLQSGMKLESISRFLGHSSLESTQIYTHLAGVGEGKKQSFKNIRRHDRIQLHEDEH
jgi:integrase/recombinase XerD